MFVARHYSQYGMTFCDPETAKTNSSSGTISGLVTDMLEFGSI